MEKIQDDLKLNFINKDNISLVRTNFCVVFVFLFFLIFLFFGGIYSNSLIVMADALLLLWSLIGFITFIVKKKFTENTPNNLFNFGYLRMECISVIISIICIWIFSFELLKLSVERIISNKDINGKLVIISSLASIVINIIQSYFIHYKVKNLN